MQSRGMRLGLLAAVIVAAVLLFIVLQSDNGDESSDSAAKTVQVLSVDANGDPVGGEKTLTYNKGDQVRLRVNLAKPEETIHVHGYEIEKRAETSPVTFSFPARLDGVFEIEVHRLDHSEGAIAELRVNP